MSPCFASVAQNDMEKSRYVWQPDRNETPQEKGSLKYGTQRASDPSNIRKHHSRRLDLVLLVVAAVVIRGSDLKEPPFAVYEESKVAGNVNRYYDGRFFLSDEPPLATLLYYLLTRMIGFKGSEQYFEPNQTFVGTGFPFYFLRCVSVGLGVAEIGLTYSTLNRSRLSRASTLLGSLMLLFENSYVTQHRYFFTQAWILFIALVNVSFWMPKNEHSEEQMNEFGWRWWRFVLSTSLCCALAGALSSTGFYAILIGLICSTWTLLQRLGTPKYPVGRAVLAWAVHWSIAALLVIGLYIGCILVHLTMTPNSGTHDILMSGQFQAHLNGNVNDLQPLTVRYGSLVTLRHGKTNAYLHSHEALYPKGSGQQQISLYRYRDGNNVWMVEPSDVDLLEELTGTPENSTFPGKTVDPDDENQENAPRTTVSGDSDEKQKLLSSLLASVSSVLSPSSARPNAKSSKPVRSTSAPVPKTKAKKSTFGKPVAEPIRLRHMNTQRRLHSHEVAPPVSPDEFQKEVSAYGEAGCAGDSNDVWIVEAYNDDNSHRVQPWMALRTMVRLRHANLGCYLFGHDVQLPEWGQSQLEVTCSTQGKVENSFWYVESNYHPMVANGTLHEEYIAYPPLSLLEKFTEYVDAMHDAAEVLSAPQHWMSPAYRLPLLPDAVPLYQNHHRQVRLIGNPCIWALCVMGLAGYCGVAMIQRFGSQRMFDPFPAWKRYERAATLSFVAWVVYYMPLFGFRAVDIGDYLPALWSSMLVFVIVWEYLVRVRLAMPRLHTVSCILLVTLCMVSFRGLWPLAYATEWTPELCVNRERSWFLDCDLYLNSTNAYREYDSDNHVHFMEVIPRTGWK